MNSEPTKLDRRKEIRELEADELGVIVHDDSIHPDQMTFDEEDKPQ